MFSLEYDLLQRKFSLIKPIIQFDNFGILLQFIKLIPTSFNDMDRLLKPQILNVDLGDPLAFEAYKHWIKTFNAFAEAAQQSLQTADQGEDAPNRGVD